jgi:hypothetical protein
MQKDLNIINDIKKHEKNKEVELNVEINKCNTGNVGKDSELCKRQNS